MPQIDTTLQISQPPTSGDQANWLKSFFDNFNRLYGQLASLINGSISFGDGTVGSTDNISGVWETALTVAGNFTVTHNLGRLPVGYLMVKNDAFENLKFISSTTTTIVLAGQNGGANILLFIL